MEAGLEFWLPYGLTEVPVAVPDENLLGFLSPLEDSTSETPESAISTALEYRIGDKTLHEAAGYTKRTVIAFNPNSGACAQYANLLAAELSRTNPGGVCLLQCATDPTQPRSGQAQSDKNLETSCQMNTHDPRTSPSVRVGQLEDSSEVLLNETFMGAEIKCVVTNVALNPFWGYSGGPSFVVPGLASEKTIKASLRSTLKSARVPGVLSGNPTYETLVRMSDMARIDFAVHLVERPDGKLAGIFAGDFLGTFDQACALAGRIFRPPLQRKADIVISSAGGALGDRTLFDASLATMISATCCKDHGIMILVAECVDGGGRFPSPGLVVRDSRAHPAQSQKAFTLERLVEYHFRRITADHRVYLVSTLPEHQASLYGLLSARSVGSALQRAIRHAGKDATVALIPYGCHTAPLVG